jgi:hypothetical protein
VTRCRWLLAVTLACCSCSDAGPVAGPGTLTATLVSPHGPEGAAVIALLGEGVGATFPVGNVQLFRGDDGGVTRLVLVDSTGGELAFQVDVADTTHLPTAVVEQVADPDDALRGDPTSYRLELSR